MLGFRSGHSWSVTNCTLRHSKTIAMDIGDEGGFDPEGVQPTPYFLGNHTIERNRIVDNGGKAITGDFGSIGPQPLDLPADENGFRVAKRWQRFDARGQPCPECEVHRNRGGRIAFNIIAGNNYLGLAAENAALKVHGFSGEVTGNLIIGNFYSVGMWFDDLWWNLRISRNTIVSQRVGDWGGIMLEVSTGPALVDNNVIISAFRPGTFFAAGYQGGIYESDSNNATIVQNLVSVYGWNSSDKFIISRDVSTHTGAALNMGAQAAATTTAASTKDARATGPDRAQT